MCTFGLPKQLSGDAKTTTMKTQSPTTVAYKYLTSIYTARKAQHSAPKVDRRTKFGRAVLAEYHRIKSSVDYTAISKKQAQRRAAAQVCGNILTNPLVRDWMSNKGRYGFKITANRIIDGGRNHWAKSDLDRKILAILAGK